jgi:hypothetical protein
VNYASRERDQVVRRRGDRSPSREQQRPGIQRIRAKVQEMEVLTIDGGVELRQRVQLRLVRTPVVTCVPVLGQSLQVADWHTALPSYPRQFVRPAGVVQPLIEIVQVGLHLDAERMDVGDDPLVTTKARGPWIFDLSLLIISSC